MEEKGISELTDEELLLKAKKIKSDKKTNAALIGVVVGIGLFSIFRNGFGLLPLILFLCVLVAVKKGKKSKAIENAVEQEIASRNLK